MGAVRAKTVRELFEQSVVLEKRFGRLRRPHRLGGRRTLRALFTVSLLWAGISAFDRLAG